MLAQKRKHFLDEEVINFFNFFVVYNIFNAYNMIMGELSNKKFKNFHAVSKMKRKENKIKLFRKGNN